MILGSVAPAIDRTRAKESRRRARLSIIKKTNIIVRVTTLAVHGSSLHVDRGHVGGAILSTIGYEAVGYIAEIGSSVSLLVVGDQVIIPDTILMDHLEIELTAKEYFGFGNSEMGLGGLQGSAVSVIPMPTIIGILCMCFREEAELPLTDDLALLRANIRVM
ncbi:hypothetical protein GCG54_00015370 [Colletotrichum gloeosporioides]|uniref:Alcohol dehydrogenase-like N-terminal domain-containing protein n=1 Tax=Colletotrichum gloeosporioides TaxID=474922 RepID=A0A8H4CPY9_COLGL|nr:uncharacterized protein GCG54_00015370 [Colletotrichum gloeosporioides]KAF3807986.1 hypothetical protein GCG54_00015370 [Colletotrichum gloeosporioides]